MWKHGYVPLPPLPFPSRSQPSPETASTPTHPPVRDLTLLRILLLFCLALATFATSPTQFPQFGRWTRCSEFLTPPFDQSPSSPFSISRARRRFPRARVAPRTPSRFSKRLVETDTLFLGGIAHNRLPRMIYMPSVAPSAEEKGYRILGPGSASSYAIARTLASTYLHVHQHVGVRLRRRRFLVTRLC